MTDTHLPDFPMQSHEAALPYLRRPYLVSQVWAKIQSVPKNQHAPCTVVLYSIGETMMDRFNLICGSDWSHEFETLTETKSPGQKPWWYCKVRATITALGKTETDIGDGYGPTQAAAEMNARAQAGKRAARWHGPGQCLYAADEILMWRDGDGEDRLCIPKAGNDRFENPFFDQQGVGQKYCRGRYDAYLKRDGEAVYGEPLDHLAIAAAIQARPTVVAVAIPNGITRESPATPHHTNGRSPAAALIDAPTADAPGPDDSQPPIAAAPAAKEWPPMPDHPAPPAALQAAQEAGYGEPAARLLSNLARGQQEDAKFGDAQLQAVANWITVLGELEIAEDAIVRAIAHNATKKTSQERRQAKFVKWLSDKASGEADTKAQAPESDSEAPDTQTDSEPTNANGNDQLEAGKALAELRQAKTDNEYTDRTVTRIAALATGVGPKARVDWPKVPAETLTILAELLRGAGSLGWKNDQLDQEILKYHNSTQQPSAAGRFSAFANYLTDLAETRAMAQDDVVEVG